jgi:hypothetical protein
MLKTAEDSGLRAKVGAVLGHVNTLLLAESRTYVNRQQLGKKVGVDVYERS